MSLKTQQKMFCLLAKDVKTAGLKPVEWGHVKTNRILSVKWEAAEAEAVPIVFAVGLEVLAADRLLQFVRNNPHGARFSANNDPRRGKPVMVL
jgi:hypothetical protein